MLMYNAEKGEENMNRTKSAMLILSTTLIVLGVVVSSFLSGYGSIISSVVTTITAIIGAVALYIQFKKDKDVNQASFMMQFHEYFYSTEGCKTILDVLDEHANGKFSIDLTDKKYYKDIMGYLGWIRTLCSLIDNRVLEINKIDEIFSYRFFAILNNKQIQDIEIVKNRQYYSLIYQVYQKWVSYRRKHGKYIVFDETSLDKTEHYAEIVNVK